MRVLIIGDGYGARVYLPALLGIPDVEEVLLASGHLGHWPHVKNYGVRQVSDWEKALKNEFITACAVVVPSFCQFEVTSRVLESGVLPIVEKPGGTVPEDVAILKTQAGAERINVGYSFRFMRGLQEMLRDIQEGSVGKVRRISIQWITSGWSSPKRKWTWRCDINCGGGVLYEYASHCFDYLRFLTSSPVNSVFCSTSTCIPRRYDSQGVFRDVTSPDTADLLLHHADECVTQICIMTIAGRGFGHRIEVHGDKGYASWFHAAPFRPGEEEYVTAVGTNGNVQKIVVPLDSMNIHDSRIPATCRMLESFLTQITSSVLAPDMPAASLNDTEQVLKILKAAEASALQGVTITMPRKGSSLMHESQL